MSDRRRPELPVCGMLALIALLAAPAGAAAPQQAVEGGRVRGGVTHVPGLQTQGTDRAPTWLPAFGQKPGTDGYAGPVTVFDDGSGPALYAGGGFLTAGGVSASRIAEWNGTHWSPLGSGLNGFVAAMAVFDDGSGPALFVAGGFSQAGGQFARGIAKWNGTSWSALGNGSAGMFQVVYALAVFDDGGGPALYAGGAFSGIGGLTVANGIAKWNGTSWSALEWGVVGSVRSLAVFDDGSGLALYAGGSFAQTGGQLTVDNLARWDGSSWSAVGGGANGVVQALTVFDDGTGPALFAGGEFTAAGGGPAQRLAKWNGSSWAAVGDGMEDSVVTLSVLDDGSGSALYAGGDFTTAGGIAANRIAKWNGSTWSALGAGVDDTVAGFTVFDDGTGAALYVGGRFELTGDGLVARHIAKWDGGAWSASGRGVDDSVKALAVFDDGSGPALIAAGQLTAAGGVPASQIARWDGTDWSALGSGIETTVETLAVFDDGSGPALYAGGYFLHAGGIDASRIARWDGASWSALGAGVAYPSPGFAGVRALAVFDDGSGPALFAGGGFSLAGGAAADNIARWNGSVWSALGPGVSGGSPPVVWALAIFDDGSGPALVVGGSFDHAGGAPANSIARWDGSTWSTLGGGLTGPVRALAVFDDGSGPALYAASASGGVSKWDGSTWTLGVGGGVVGGVNALAVHDDGSGPALFAAGSIVTAGGIAANRIAKWDGANWSALGNLVLGGGSPSILALASVSDETGPVLYAGGGFATSGTFDSHIVKWGCAEPTVWNDLGFALAGAAGAPHLAGTGPLTTGSAGTLPLTNAASSALASLLVSLTGTPTPFKGGVLVPIPILLALSLNTSPAGSIPLGWSAWPAGLSGFSLYFQYAIQDAGAPNGLALSNALRADVP